MKIKVLGTRAKVDPSAPGHENHTGFLIDGKVLVDVGEREYLKYDPEAIIFTHFHPDHAFFVSANEKFIPEIPLFGPEENELIPNLQLVTKKFELHGYEITPVPVLHALKLKSLGYIIEKDEKRIFITGDVAWIEKDNLKDLPRVDLVITEATFIKKGGRVIRKKERIFGHTGVPNLVNLLRPLTRQIAFSHYGNWFYEDIENGKKAIKDLAEDVELVPTYDGMELEI